MPWTQSQRGYMDLVTEVKWVLPAIIVFETKSLMIIYWYNFVHWVEAFSRLTFSLIRLLFLIAPQAFLKVASQVTWFFGPKNQIMWLFHSVQCQCSLKLYCRVVSSLLYVLIRLIFYTKIFIAVFDKWQNNY